MGVGFAKNSTRGVLNFQPKVDAFPVKNGVRANGELMITFTPKNGETTICGVAEPRDLLLTFAAPRFLQSRHAAATMSGGWHLLSIPEA